MIGETILHYKILEKLGEGGMGVVYLAEDLNLERKVAIKFLPRHIAGNSEERERFKIEAKAAAALNHPNIATIYAIEESGEDTFIVMEFIDGIELKDKIKSGPIPIKEAINIAIQIAEGLEAAHKKKIIHRDIKSQNIMITDDGKVKIMDFGLAKVKGGIQLTQMGLTVGTIANMSPEQARGREVDHRTDIWSFGVVLYEMITGQMPFRGDYDQAIIYSIMNKEPQPAGEIDKELKHIIDKSLNKEQSERYGSAGEIAEELRTISQGGEVKRTQKNKSKLPWIITGAVVIIVAIALYLFIPSSKGGKESAAKIKTIAILPFTDMSQNKDQGYFSDGMAEELINVLSRNPRLRVTARTSSFYFRGKDVDLKTIASKLNVKNILEGSVQKAGNNLRISADLVNTETDATLWSDTYDGTMNNIFALQDSISGNVAEALNAALLGKDAAAPEQKTDPEAYNNYLLGNHFYDLRGRENLKRAAGYYSDALSIDSNYVPAWLGLSKVHISEADYGYISLDIAFSKARQEAERALSLNPKLAGAYVQIGRIENDYSWNWSMADKYYTKALELEPENASAMIGAANLASTLGRFNRAINLAHRSIQIDPISAVCYYDLGFYTNYAGLRDESISAYKNCLKLNPHFPNAHVFMGVVYLEQNKLDSAEAEIKKEAEPDGKIYGPSLVYYKLGRKKEADDMFNLYIKKYHGVDAYQIAEIYAYRGERDKAFEWLERAYIKRDGGLAGMVGDPLMHNIVKDPRYAAFMKKMKLPL